MQSGIGCGVLGTIYHDGEGVAKNLSKAKELFGKACDFGEQAGCDAYKNLNKLGVEQAVCALRESTIRLAMMIHTPLLLQNLAAQKSKQPKIFQANLKNISAKMRL